MIFANAIVAEHRLSETRRNEYVIIYFLIFIALTIKVCEITNIHKFVSIVIVLIPMPVMGFKKTTINNDAFSAPTALCRILLRK